MFNNKVASKFTNGVAFGSAVLGAITVTTLTTSPAQAGTLGWSNGVSDFYSQVDFSDPDNTFSVTFSPDNITLVSTASDEFAPPFPVAPPPVTQNLTTPAIGNFEFVQSGGGGIRAFYQLTSPLAFNFTNGVSITWPTGTIVAGEFDDDPGSVQFQLSNPPGEIGENTLPIVTGLDEDIVVLPTDVLQFGDGIDSTGGTYNGDVDVRPHGSGKIPEPGTVVGILAVGGLGLLTKRKKQA